MSRILSTLFLSVVFTFCIGSAHGVLYDLIKLPIKKIVSDAYAASSLMPPQSLRSEKKNLPYVLMVTSLDEWITSTPLSDVQLQTTELLDGSPFDGVALNLMDIYSGQSISSEEKIIKRANELKAISKKDIWVRVNINRINQRRAGDPYYEKGWTQKDLAALPATGLPFAKVRKTSTVYFDKIKGMDIYDEAGALSDFYRIWTLSLKFSKIMGSGIVLDLENYHNQNNAERNNVSFIAYVQNRSVIEIITKLEQIGAQLADIAAQEYPQVTVLNLFSFYKKTDYEKGQLAISAYICNGLLTRAKEKKMLMKFIDGGEVDIGYVNTSLYSLSEKIKQRGLNYRDWLERFPNNFYLGATITVWDDPAKISGWVKQYAMGDLYFKSLADFRPYLAELSRNYNFIWIYVPSIIDYKPFDPILAPAFNKKLDVLIKEQRRN